jgi:four helix bundle protein
LNDLECYHVVFELRYSIWAIIISWNYSEKDTEGKQFVRAVDSISVSIAEGFGRYGKKDKIKFYKYAKGSLQECFDWNKKIKIRNLISPEQYEVLSTEFNKLPKPINAFIKFTNENLSIKNINLINQNRNNSAIQQFNNAAMQQFSNATI